MLNEIKIKYFLVLSDTLNFTAAAEELHITQQALSKQISQLETELECTLFHRTTRGVVLTDAGLVMQKAFLTMQNSLEHARTEIKNDLRNSSRVLNIGCGAGLRPGPFFTPLANRFMQASGSLIWYGQPDTYDDLVTWLSQDKFDFILCTDDYGGDPGQLQKIELCRTPLYFFVNRDLPTASVGASLYDFRNQPFYVTSNEQRTNRILSLCMRERFYPEHIFTTANPYSTYLMTEMGEAITFGSGFSMLHTNPAVRAYRIPGEEVHLVCMYNPENLSSLSKEFIEFLRDHRSMNELYFPQKI